MNIDLSELCCQAADQNYNQTHCYELKKKKWKTSAVTSIKQDLKAVIKKFRENIERPKKKIYMIQNSRKRGKRTKLSLERSPF